MVAWIQRQVLIGAGRSFSTAPSLDPKEALKFSSLSARWWDPSGPFAPLHRLNPARCQFIRDAVIGSTMLRPMGPLGQGSDAPSTSTAWDPAEPLAGIHALDVGCGGGILSESLARMGARVSEKAYSAVMYGHEKTKECC